MSEEKTLHIKKFDGGQRTPAEVHREVGLAHACSFCAGPAALKVHYIAPLDEFIRREPGLFALAVAQNGGRPIHFETTYGLMVRMETVYGCDLCKASLRRAAANKPDWVLCEFDEAGLEASHPLVVQSPGIPG